MAYAAALGLSLLVFFHVQVGTRFGMLLGDRYDTGIEIAILEHWYNVARGFDRWDQVRYFHPYPATLGYNDGYFLFGLPYAAARMAGADPFLAGEVVNVVLRGVGFAGFEWLMRRQVGVGWRWALAGAVLFTLAGNASSSATHAQMLSVGFMPVFVGLLWGAAVAWSGARWRTAAAWAVAARASAAGVLMGAWLLTAYYTAWFTLFLTLVVGLLAVVSAPGRTWALIRYAPRAAWVAVAVAGGVTLLAFVPFLVVYLPKAAATGMHPFEEVRFYATRPLDLVHVGAGHPLLSWLDAGLQGYFRPGLPANGEHAVGLGIGLLVAFGLATRAAWRARAVPTGRAMVLVGAATMLVWALTVRIGADMLWRGIFHAVPGAAGLRVIVRYQVVMTAPVVCVAVWWLSRVRWSAWRRPALAVAAVVALLVGEEVSVAPPVHLERAVEEARLLAVPVPPAACRVFYVSAGRPGGDGSEIAALYSHNVDAMLVAQRFHVSTVNGFSTFQPPDWAFNHPEAADYPSRVARFAAAHGLVGLCGLDLTQMRWTERPFG